MNSNTTTITDALAKLDNLTTEIRTLRRDLHALSERTVSAETVRAVLRAHRAAVPSGTTTTPAREVRVVHERSEVRAILDDLYGPDVRA